MLVLKKRSDQNNLLLLKFSNHGFCYANCLTFYWFGIALVLVLGIIGDCHANYGWIFQVQLEHLPSMVAGVWSDDSNLQLEATTQFRKLLSIGKKFDLSSLMHLLYMYICFNYSPFFSLPERSPPIEEVIQSGVVPRFVEFLMREDYPQLQVYCMLSIIWWFFLDVCDREYNIVIAWNFL